MKSWWNRPCKALAGALLMAATVAPHVGPPQAQGDETAEAVFRDQISGPIVQSRCVNCHVLGGLSGHTRLVFVRRASEVDHLALNLRAFENFLAAVEDEGGGMHVLNKIQGVSHGGGVQVPLGSADFANMQRFLGLLGEQVATAALTPETLFDTVVLASDRRTLRRAALIFAGRLPTEAEYAAVEDGDEAALRATVRGLMEEPQFHEFLIRGSNDRLLTDQIAGRILDDTDPYLVDFANEAYGRKKVMHANGDERSRRDFYLWLDSVEYGARRAPLELIAYVAQNDLPYTEILTADYIMANPWSAAAYGASTPFVDPANPYEFRPSRIVEYYRKGHGFDSEYDPVLLAIRVLDPGPLGTDYPHAGILNTTSFLHRYPTTATNRNRARARWTYYHFLGVDVEKSASRTTDPAALADTNNPTMYNPACTVCHSVLDPVAGAFQNYGDDGLYKDQWGGLDSLDEFYKREGGPSQAIEAEYWAERESVEWTVSLAAGVNTLRVMFANHFWDEAAQEGSHVFLDRLDVKDADGQTLVSREFEDMEVPVADWGNCGRAQSSQTGMNNDHLVLWGGYEECALYIDVETRSCADCGVEVLAWSDGFDERYGDGGFAEVSVAVNAYEYGDTWYNDMRMPGFAGAEAPHPDNSLQWLAGQIVADDRFAEATVKFWWPAIMGSEVAEPPEDAADADFEALLLAASAQDSEVLRLADGFRDGFPGSVYTYNLRDLLVEIVLSKWFRAEAITDTKPVRRAALHGAGARRLLTPEELARKTAVITGVQWERHTRSYISYQGPVANALTTDYRLLYGGIDSDGITERSRDLTTVMSGVAQRNAVQVSCPVVLRELYLLPEAERRLFTNVDVGVTPGLEFSASFAIEADSRDHAETLSVSGELTAGSKTVRLTYANDEWYPDGPDRKIRLDRLEVRDAQGTLVERHELENFGSAGECSQPYEQQLTLYCDSSVVVTIHVPAAGSYEIVVVAWADHAGDELPVLDIGVVSDSEDSAGSTAIKSQLVELHDKLLGVQVAPDSPDVEAAYQLFVDAMRRGRELGEVRFDPYRCDFGHDLFFFDGIAESAVVQRENERGDTWHEYDWDRVDEFLRDVDFSDPYHTAQAWVVVLTALVMDYRYLFL